MNEFHDNITPLINRPISQYSMTNGIDCEESEQPLCDLCFHGSADLQEFQVTIQPCSLTIYAHNAEEVTILCDLSSPYTLSFLQRHLTLHVRPVSQEQNSFYVRWMIWLLNVLSSLRILM